MFGQAPTSTLSSSEAAITPYLEPKDSPGCFFFLSHRARTEKKSSREDTAGDKSLMDFSQDTRQEGFYHVSRTIPEMFLNIYLIYMYFQIPVLFILLYFKEFGNFRYLKFFSLLVD